MEETAVKEASKEVGRTEKETLIDVIESGAGIASRSKKEHRTENATETSGSQEVVSTGELGIEAEKESETDGGQRTMRVVGRMIEPRRVAGIKVGTKKLSENDPQRESDPRSEKPEEGDTGTGPHYPTNKSASKDTEALAVPMLFPKVMILQKK